VLELEEFDLDHAGVEVLGGELRFYGLQGGFADVVLVLF
jgi:hypothetical protein